MTKAILIIFIGIFIFCLIFWKAIRFECNSNCRKTNKKITPTYTVLMVKDNEDCIEGVIYSIIKEMRSKNNMPISPSIVVIDLGSNDSTVEISEKISKKYEFIHILHSNSYIDIVNK